MANNVDSTESVAFSEKETVNAQLVLRYTNQDFIKKLQLSVRGAFVGSYDWGRMDIKYLYCEKSVPRFRVNWWDWNGDKILVSKFITVTEKDDDLLVGVK
jgi:hypothetical protein